jgi:TfoX/Sxy family transcriptional regulator of competence genes
MQMAKASEESKALFRAVVPDAPGAEVKPMFGNLGAFVNGNMFAGLFGDRIGVRVLDDETRAELAAIAGVEPFGPAERPMGGYLALPEAWAEEPERLSEWIGRAFEAVAALPAKQPKAAKAPKGPKPPKA